MPFKNPESAFRDILDAAILIEQFTSDMTLEGFRSDPKTVAAVERKLQVISEAAIRLGPEAEKRCPDQPWADIRGIGNWLRHRPAGRTPRPLPHAAATVPCRSPRWRPRTG